ncbi:MAG: TadE/TadG family type IV pilus assembly protein [Raoultibacter sp.]
MSFSTERRFPAFAYGVRGQATVEAAFLIPLIFLALLLLLQPGIMLYTRMVMEGAAAEGCRLLVTKVAGAGDEAYKACILRRLGAVPQQDNFHVHSGGCTWDIQLEGDESSTRVCVTIENQAKPLPLIDAASTLLGMVNSSGNFSQTVSVSAQTQPDWVANNQLGLDPQAWVQRWV